MVYSAIFLRSSSAASANSYMSLGLFASGLTKYARRSSPADGPGARSPNPIVEQFFQLLQSGIIGLCRAERPFEHVVFDRLPSKCGHCLQLFVFVVRDVNRDSAHIPMLNSR